MRAFFLLVTLCFLCAEVILAQTYSDVSLEQGISVMNNGANFGSGVSFYDFDKDGWDDLTIGSKNQPILCFRNIEGTYESFPLAGVDFVGEPKQIVWVDFDNDSDMDLFVSYTFDRVRLYENNGNFGFSEIGLEAGLLDQPHLENWGASWGDFDRDGDLDLYSCKLILEGEDFPLDHTLGNTLYENNGDGSFTDVSLETQTTDSLGISYQSLFTDIDQDGWPDLFVINDKWFLNSFYRNTGLGYFEDEGALRQLDYLMDAMCIAADDYDNDGDMDFYITNTSFAGGGVGNLLFKNNNGVFNTLPTSTGINVLQTCWGSVWFDYDNNGLQDLWVTANFAVNPMLNPLFKNEGQDTFTQINDIAGLADNVSRAYSIAMGDVNNDGYADIIQGNANPYSHQLFLSSGGEANWLKVSVEGTISNKDGIGSKIRVFTPVHTQFRETYCGEGYLSQNSQREMFGLGNLDVVDSLSIDWPSGMREVYYNLPANETYHFIEGATFEVSAISNVQNICLGDSALLIAQGLENNPAIWNNGFIGDSLYVFSPGTYSFSTQNNFGIPTSSNEININFYEAQSSEVSLENIACFGDLSGAAALLDSSFTNIVWSNGEMGDALQLPFGWSTYNALDSNGCAVSDSVFVDQAEALIWNLSTVDEVIDESLGAAVITPSGGTAPYSFDWGDENCNSSICSNLSAGEYLVLLTDANMCSTEIVVSIDAVTSINEQAFERIELFPNPVNDFLFVKNSASLRNFEIRSASGALVLAGLVSEQGIDMKALEKGVYLLILSNTNHSRTVTSLFMKN